MSTAETTVDQAEALARACHPSCVACGDPRHGGLGLRFAGQPDDSVVAEFSCNAQYEGYPGHLHGGVIATLLDAAMMHWLFAHQTVAVTTKLEVQYRHPVLADVQAEVRASLLWESPSYHVLKAELTQHGTTRAVAKGVFTLKAADPPEGSRPCQRFSNNNQVRTSS